MFPHHYVNEVCPLDGYSGITVRVLANPTPAEQLAWFREDLGTAGCEACAALNPPLPDIEAGAEAIERTAPARAYCSACAATRAAFGVVLSLIYRETTASGLDFSTPEAAIATVESPDVPGDLTSYLFMLPPTVWDRRIEDLKKKLKPSSTSPV